MPRVRLLKQTNTASEHDVNTKHRTLKEFWEEKKQRKFVLCSACIRKAELGALVSVKSDLSGKSYVIPICRYCLAAKADKEFVVGEFELVELE